MTFLEQIRANNDPNSPDRIKARELLQDMETSENVTVEEVRDSCGNLVRDGYGRPVKTVTDENGETWVQFTADI